MQNVEVRNQVIREQCMILNTHPSTQKSSSEVPLLIIIYLLEILPICMCMKILIGFVPKQQEYSLGKSLEVVVAINLRVILHLNLPEYLNHKQQIIIIS